MRYSLFLFFFLGQHYYCEETHHLQHLLNFKVKRNQRTVLDFPILHRDQHHISNDLKIINSTKNSKIFFCPSTQVNYWNLRIFNLIFGAKIQISHYSKSQIFVQKFNFDKTPTFSRVFHPNFFHNFTREIKVVNS